MTGNTPSEDGGRRAAPAAGGAARTGVLLFLAQKKKDEEKDLPRAEKAVGLFRTSRGRGFLPVFTDCFAGFQEPFCHRTTGPGRARTPCPPLLLPPPGASGRERCGSESDAEGVRNHLPGAKACKRGLKSKRPSSHGASRMKAAGSAPKVSQRARDPQNDPKRSFWDRPSAPFFWTVHGPFSLGKTQRKWGVQMPAFIKAICYKKASPPP